MRQTIIGVCVVIALLDAAGDTGAELKKLRTGTTIGELKSVGPARNKRDTEIEVLAPGEEKPRRYTVGAQQKDVVAAVKAAKVGDRVEIEWFDTVEGLCVEKFQVLNAARGDEPDAVKAERKALAGDWVCQSSEVNGVKRGAAESKGQTIAFDGEKCVQRDAATGEEMPGTYQLDLGGNRKVLTTKLTVGTREVTVRYIFVRDGDTLKLCADLRPGAELPTEFTAPEGSRRMLAVFKRAGK